ncbi:MAG: Autophagy protein 22 [Chaenotheca gracillima]|nr:MAG: Autophagy protein 22 [Chaenotheca gracillima]
MPHSTNDQDDSDQREIDKLLEGDDLGNFDFSIPNLEPGEKANDAVDYEDIDDDDLADEEDEGEPALDGQAESWGNGHEEPGGDDLDGILQGETLPELQNGQAEAGEDLDDLFGDLPSSPTGQHDIPNGTKIDENAKTAAVEVEEDDHAAEPSAAVPTVTANQEETVTSQEELFRTVNFAGKKKQDAPPPTLGLLLPPPPENSEEALAAMWPKFRPNEIPNFMELLPPKKSHYVGKTPLKAPKAVQPSKLNLEISTDQERTFKSAGPTITNKRLLAFEAEQRGVTIVSDEETGSKASEDEMEWGSTPDDEEIGGVTWNDLEVLCEDWDMNLLEGPSDAEDEGPQRRLLDHEDDDLFGDVDDDWEKDLEMPASKRQKTSHVSLPNILHHEYALPSFDDPERATSRIAKRVALDLNDPHLLIDMIQPEVAVKRPRIVGPELGKGLGTTSSKDFTQRYNISNDDAYEMLKENHQSKVRSTLSNLTVEHSMPALRLQYPYYKVKLGTREARSYHRPALNFLPNVPVRFSKPTTTKRKHLRGKDAQALFPSTKHLSLGDNSNVLLLEYSEEYPAMMSNFGMQIRLINYYRRKNAEDNARPKLEIGETAVLMPHDKSPFSLFGNIEPGEVMPAMYNSMFKAPVFKQNPKPTDFLVIRNTTGVEGSTWFMRNIENICVVGQEFPSVEVPGPHSRKVTTAAKNRLKMIAFRKIRHNKHHRVNVPEVTEHFPETTDMQNRQKMKEFLQYSKEHKEWEMRPGESIPDEVAVRSMVKPEDVCLLESSQVGQRHLQDAGYSKDVEDSEEEDNNREGQSMEQQLAPWQTTKNFLHAVQGKAMLQLHGEGDPSGRGEAFSFIRTSMKGGFKAVGESVEEKLDAKKLKELGGHSYNVAKQQRAYNDSIRRIWEAQRTSLSSTVDHSELDGEDDVGEGPEDLFEEGRTPRSEAVTPAAFGARADDDIASQFSKFSSSSQRGRVLRISRNVKNSRGQVEAVQEIIRDPRVIRQYIKRRHALEAEHMTLSELKPTGDSEQDKRDQKRIQEELARLERNKDRRIARDKAKGIIHPDGSAASPNSPGSPSTVNTKSAGTQRKCANCGQVGHIKTNKKLCPLLNGTMKQEDTFPDAGFGSLGGTTSL